jgi:hypothetical protein
MKGWLGSYLILEVWMEFTEWTRLGRAHYHHPHYRSYPAQWVVDGTGDLVLLQPFEVNAEGAWEGFVQELERRPAPGRN